MTVETENGPIEMGKYLRQIVDNSLEEGQFESAIAMLDQMRSPDHKPSIIHILHLAFISLHSSSHICRLDDAGADPVYDSESLLRSPRKIIKQSKSAIVLSPEAITSAQRLLFSFIATNPPQAIGAALPRYPESEDKRHLNVDGESRIQFASEYVDSPIYSQSIAIRNARSVWEVLREGFVQRAAHSFGTPKGKGRAKQGIKTRALAKEGSFGAVSTMAEGEDIKAVSDDSWVFLEWLVALFEKDAHIVQTSGLLKHSPLLLRQLPPPSIGTNTRWDASEPLKVVLCSLQQTDLRRRRTGSRLMNLLIDLTYAQYLSIPSFASTVLSQLASSAVSRRASPESSPPQAAQPNDTASSAHSNANSLTALLSILPNTAVALPFKIALCQKILQELNGTPYSSAHPKPKPTPRTTSSFRNKDTDATDAPNLGINPSTGQPLVSAMKKPQPRPRTSTITAASSSTQGTASIGMASPPPIASVSSGSTTISSAAVSTAPTYLSRSRLPPFAEVSELATAQSKNQPQAHTKPERQTRGGRSRLAIESDIMNQQPQAPWLVPDVLLRVKFEFLLACAATLTLQTQASEEPQPLLTSGSNSEAFSDWKLALEDGRFRTLIGEVFASSPGGEDERESADKSFYADVIMSVAGYNA